MSTVSTLFRWVLLGLPTLVAAVYFCFVATDRYVSEAQFVLRTAAKPVGGAGFGAILQMAGLGRAQDDAYSVQSFLGSRGAIAQLAERVPILKMYGLDDADSIARYPSIFYGSSREELFRYLSWMITTEHNSTTGITTLRVQAFRPEDAKEIASQLLDLSEQAVNRMNARAQSDTLRVAEQTVKRDEERLVAAQIAITRFRNNELMIDPVGSSVVVTELIARLSAELAQTQAQVREIQLSATSNPLLASHMRRASALQAQIGEERRRISTDAEGLADKLAEYERLVLDREFAKQNLSASVRSMEAARQEARLQQLYLERIVEPVAPDYATAPQRARMIATIFGINAVLLLVGWLTYSGVREHAAHA